ncbi:hypothetical protein EDD86DRAFT_197630 [Gorgonomyces haynaldii]|nr:hypothetical protein EDD86DRAFT_197630 [Gorgonomyces haynaldii]
MCSSKAVQEPTDWTNIPILMSKERIIGSEIVYDAVFHPRVMEKAQSDVDFGRDLRDLAKGCVKELYGVDLVEPGVSHPGYFGPYGWNDKNGQSLTGDEIQKQSEIKLKEEEPEIEIKTSLEPKKPVLIEEIVEVPKFVTKWTDRYEITLFLPDVNKQDIVTKTLGSKLTVQAGKYQWEHQLPSNVDPNEPQCKFVNSKLKLKFSRV